MAPTVGAGGSLSIGAAEHEDETIWIAHLELPITVGLMFEWHLYERSAFYCLIQRVHAVDANVGVPQSSRAPIPEIGLFIISQGEQHDLDRSAHQACEHVWLLLRHGSDRVEPEGSRNTTALCAPRRRRGM